LNLSLFKLLLEVYLFSLNDDTDFD